MALLTAFTEGDVRVVQFGQTRALDQKTVDVFSEELKAMGARTSGGKLLLNFEGVQYVSSVVVGRLIAFHKQCQADKIDLKMCSMSPELMEIIKIMSLHKVFKIYDDQAKGLAAYNKSRWFLS